MSTNIERPTANAAGSDQSKRSLRGRPKQRLAGPVCEVCWRELVFSEPDRRVVARGIVAVLKQRPGAVVDGQQALHAGDGNRAVGSTAQVAAPISYAELDERFIFAGLDAVQPEARRFGSGEAVETSAFRQAREKLRAASGFMAQISRANTGARSQMMRKRPGRGGRRPRRSGAEMTAATAEFRAEAGEPQEQSLHGIKLQWWDHRDGKPAADGMALGRLSGQELQEGETIMGQVHALRRLCQDQGIVPAYTVITLNNGGGERYEHRPDFAFLEEKIRSGEVNWVAVRDLDRLIRDDLAKATLFDLLKRTNTGLYIARWGRRVDLRKERLTLNVTAMIGEEERENIRERTQTPINSRYVAEGHGRPGSIRFGFFRDPVTRHPRVDPEQWPFIRRIHFGYDRRDGKPGSIRQIEDELEEMGCPFSAGQIARILRDPIYVTGEFTTETDGVRVSCKPIPLKDPIPADVFQRNQERLAQHRGPNSVTPVGFYCLNGLPVLHATCADSQVPNGKGKTTRPMLRGRQYRRRDNKRLYGHKPRCPDGCRGWAVDADLLERTVVSEVRRLAGCKALQEEWAQAPRFDLAKSNGQLQEDERRPIEAKLSELEVRREQLADEFVDRMLEDKELGDDEYQDVVGPLNRQIKQLRRQLEVADVAPQRVIAPDLRESLVLSNMANAGEVDDEEPDLVAALHEILTHELPEDPEDMRRRAAVLQVALSAVIVHDLEDGIGIELRGPLVPPNAKLLRPISPVDSARRILESYREEQSKGLDGGDVRDGVPLHKPSTMTSQAERLVQSAVPIRAAKLSELGGGDLAAVIDYREFSELYFSKDWETISTRAKRDGQRRRARVGWVPAWVSPMIKIETSTRPRVRVSVEDCAVALREARKLIDSKLRLSAHRYEDIQTDHPEWPTRTVITKRGKDRNWSWPQMVAYALHGDPDAGPAGDAELRPMAGFVGQVPVSYCALRRAASEGRLQAVRHQGRWLTRWAWVEAYGKTINPEDKRLAGSTAGARNSRRKSGPADDLRSKNEPRASNTSAADRFPGKDH